MQSGFSQTAALLASFGFGAVNFVFAGPAIWTIDTFGRRNLLLVSFPLMAVMLLMTGFALYVLFSLVVSPCCGSLEVLTLIHALAGYRSRVLPMSGSLHLGSISLQLHTRPVKVPYL